MASGLSVDEIVDLGRRISWFNMTGLSYSPRALLSNSAMGNFIRQNFPVHKFEELKIPYAAVACDLNSGEQVVFRDKGDLGFAIRASCAVPGVFTPLDDEVGRTLIDGGVIAPVPVNVVREMGADVVIAVDLLACGSNFRSSPRTALGMLFQSAMMLLRAASQQPALPRGRGDRARHRALKTGRDKKTRGVYDTRRGGRHRSSKQYQGLALPRRSFRTN